jgi:hypothetical protein
LLKKKRKREEEVVVTVRGTGIIKLQEEVEVAPQKAKDDEEVTLDQKVVRLKERGGLQGPDLKVMIEIGKVII